MGTFLAARWACRSQHLGPMVVDGCSWLAYIRRHLGQKIEASPEYTHRELGRLVHRQGLVLPSFLEVTARPDAYSTLTAIPYPGEPGSRLAKDFSLSVCSGITLQRAAARLAVAWPLLPTSPPSGHEDPFCVCTSGERGVRDVGEHSKPALCLGASSVIILWTSRVSFAQLAIQPSAMTKLRGESRFLS
ncbi:hypothetical protein GOBAR_AA23256 [Gossypium barbadense]|uniref:Uncharacterized protein n=1 Tax=Gossypium barbadense TaxID=3634 RepID=A0A2P5X253_GOSBA|nr:hypothetical protein GOBAR_AA23256 [Gossypium barbadense]